MHKPAFLSAILLSLIAPPVMASYGDHECNACHTCNYCKNCNTGGTKCGVFYESKGLTPPWKQQPSTKYHTKRRAA